MAVEMKQIGNDAKMTRRTSISDFVRRGDYRAHLAQLLAPECSLGAVALSASAIAISLKYSPATAHHVIIYWQYRWNYRVPPPTFPRFHGVLGPSTRARRPPRPCPPRDDVVDRMDLRDPPHLPPPLPRVAAVVAASPRRRVARASAFRTANNGGVLFPLTHPTSTRPPPPSTPPRAIRTGCSADWAPPPYVKEAEAVGVYAPLLTRRSDLCSHPARPRARISRPTRKTSTAASGGPPPAS
ncbi:hypothetical protein B0H16DRAFT_1888167 [Mycena metata]|uniref:Uncharacterized protein n=1 Tax=Mycena metata TaxID=1033252 RepID=A0AAD7IVA5_9AGAR|nr:hypothetical protein B0H16DRAFT_1888167 [Mycena metata]